MRTPVFLLIVGALVVAIIVTVAPSLNVTHNEAGTEVIGVDVFTAAKRELEPAGAAAHALRK